MTKIVYLRADQWGMRWNGSKTPEKTPDPEVYVHHTGGGQLSSDGATAFRLLNEYAINTKGYRALDYDVLVHYTPTSDILTIGEGRGPYMSAATLDRNEQGEAVCVLGYFHPGHALSRHPHPAETEGVALAIAWGISNGWIAPGAVVRGHRDNPAHPGATGCPGDYLQAQLPAIRTRLKELLDVTEPSPPTRNNPPKADAVAALAVVMTYCACNPGGGSQSALWDTILKHLAGGTTLAAGHPLRSAFEHYSQYPGDGKLGETWAEIKRVLGLP